MPSPADSATRPSHVLHQMVLAVITILAVGACSQVPATATPAAPSARITSASAPSATEPASPGADPEPTPSEPAPLITPSTSADPSSLLLTCGTEARFPAEALEGVGLAESENDAPAAVLRSIIAESAEPEVLPEHGWHRVVAGPDSVVFVAPRPGDPPWAVVVVTPGPDGWMPDLYGACNTQPALPEGIGAADFWLDPASPPPGPDATTLHGLILERSCAGAQPPDGRILPPVVDFDEDSVVVTVTVRQHEGGDDCPGNPIVPITIELSQPLGARSVLDGSAFPPRDASVPPG